LSESRGVLITESSTTRGYVVANSHSKTFQKKTSFKLNQQLAIRGRFD